MKRAPIKLAVMLAGLMLLPSTVFAQDDEESMSFDEAEVAEGEGEGEAPAEGVPAAEEGLPAEEGDEEAGGEEAVGETSEDDIASALGEVGIGVDGEATAPTEKAAPADQERHPIWAVQQVYALRAGRVDIQPSFGVSMNDPFVQHQSFSLGAAYYITEVLAAGLSFNWYRGLQAETDTNFSVSRATHQTVPINEYFWGGQINFSYVPLYGKFAFFKEWILHWDVWVVGGGGFIFTRPTPVIDLEYREFDFSMKFCFNVDIGGRLYLARFLAIFVELRDYIFPEELESLQTYSDPDVRADKDTWLADDLKLTNNVTLHVGVSLFVPLTFEYKLPK